MGSLKLSDATELLSSRGYDAQSSRSWFKVMGITADIYDEKTNPNGYISIGIAENLDQRLMHKELIEYINKQFRLPERMLTYADGGYGSKELRNAFAKFLTKHLKTSRPIQSENVVCFSGVTTAMECVATMIADPGDGILLGRPYYNLFPHDLSMRARVRTIEVSLHDEDRFSISGVARYEEALQQSKADGVEIRGIILCSPHNPLGRCYPRDVLIEYLKLCQKHQIHLISDEIYALSIWENEDDPKATPFTSVLGLDFAGIIDPNLIHVLWGVSKDFGANGLRVACTITQNEPMRMSLITHSHFTHISGPADKIITDVLSNQDFVEDYIKENQTRLAHAYTHVTDYLKGKEIPYYRGSNAAFFVWAELRTTYLKNHGRSLELSTEDGIKVDDELNTKLIDNRVFISKGNAYGDEIGGWFRIVFTHPDEYLDKGLQRIWEVLKGSHIT